MKPVILRCPVCKKEFEGSSTLRVAESIGTAFDLRSLHVKKNLSEPMPLYHGLFLCPHCDFPIFRTDAGRIRLAPSYREIWLRDRLAEKKVGHVADLRPPEPKSTLRAYMLAEDAYGLALGSPVPIWQRRAMACIRASWIAQDLAISGDTKMISLALELRGRARGYLERALRIEPLSADTGYGPDADHDFGPASVPYLFAVLSAEISDYESDANAARNMRRAAAHQLARIVAKPLPRQESTLTDFASKVLGELNRRDKPSHEIIKTPAKPSKPASAQSKNVPAAWRDSFLADDEIRMRVAALMPTQGRTYRPGEALVKQGDRSDHLLYLLRGRVIVQYHHKGLTVDIGHAGPGNIIGEIGALTGAPHMATVVARETVEAVALPLAFLESVTNRDKKSGLQLARHVALRLLDVLRRI